MSIVTVLLTFLFVPYFYASLSCISPNGVPVDWFMMLKSNTNAGHTNAFIKNGTAYTYVDPSTLNMTYLSRDITSTSSPIALTLREIYAGTDLSFMYNDETPAGKQSTTYGHTKGVIGFSGDQGFWLIHSVPKFPPAPEDGYSYPSSGLVYGQSFLCLTLNASNLDKVGLLQQYNRPQIYHKNYTSTVSSKIPNLIAAMDGTYVKDGGYTIQTIETAKKQSFRTYAKNTNWAKHLQQDLIGPDIGADMVWETWGRPYMEASCPAGGPDTYSATSLAGKVDDGTTYTLSSTNDHSKWGVSINPSIPYSCIGDINRQESQSKRGGGFACISNSTIQRLFTNLITGYSDCPSSKDNSEFTPLQ